jgi:hypothetical protein
MKSTKKPVRKAKASDELAKSYDFDYAKAKPNRFARAQKDQMVVLLDKEFTSFFRSPDEVTNALRSLIHAFPASSRKVKRAA